MAYVAGAVEFGLVLRVWPYGTMELWIEHGGLRLILRDARMCCRTCGLRKIRENRRSASRPHLPSRLSTNAASLGPMSTRVAQLPSGDFGPIRSARSRPRDQQSNLRPRIRTLWRCMSRLKASGRNAGRTQRRRTPSSFRYDLRHASMAYIYLQE